MRWTQQYLLVLNKKSLNFDKNYLNLTTSSTIIFYLKLILITTIYFYLKKKKEERTYQYCSAEHINIAVLKTYDFFFLSYSSLISPNCWIVGVVYLVFNVITNSLLQCNFECFLCLIASTKNVVLIHEDNLLIMLKLDKGT